ncbi:hypothetical protein I5Z76_05118 (plasmid) [Escherichia coli]
MSKSVSKEIYIRREAFLNSNPVKYQEKSKKCDKGRIFGCDEGSHQVLLRNVLTNALSVLTDQHGPEYLEARQENGTCGHFCFPGGVGRDKSIDCVNIDGCTAGLSIFCQSFHTGS